MVSIRRSGKSLLPPNMEVMAVPLVLLIVLLFLFIFAAKIGLSRLNSQKQKLAVTRREELVFRQKQEILQEVQEEVLSLADLSATAVPDKNPALAVISQLRNFASSKGVILSNLQVASRGKVGKGLSRVEVGFEAEGDFSAVINFLEEIGKTAPISRVEGVEINQSAGTTRATVSLASFWAPFPEKLPPLTEPVKDLSAEELDLVRSLSELTPPLFLEITPSVPSARTDPFAF